MIRAIARKDLAVTWLSPIPWVVGALFHLLLGLLYVGELAARRQALIQPLFPLAGFILVVVVPILSMRTLAEESRTGTLDLMMAVPVSTGRLIIGKWLATAVTTGVIVLPAGTAVLILVLYGHPDPGPILSGFLGLGLVGAGLAAIGTLASSLTSSQPVAAVIAFFIGLLLWFAHAGSQAIPTGGLLAHFSISERLRSFAAGTIDTADLGFLVILTAAALITAATVVDARKLR